MSRDAHGVPYATENEKRAERAYRAVLAYKDDGEDMEEGISDLLVDLLHLGDQYGTDAEEVMFRAVRHYRSELVEEVAA